MRKLVIILFGTVGLFFLANLGLRITGVVVWDDAYFFVRYADNLLQSGTWSWNPDTPPTYGLTSPLHGAQVALLRVGVDPPALAAWLSSLIWGVIAVFLLIRLLSTRPDPRGQLLKLTQVVGIVSLGFLLPQLTQHFTSGMDTMMGMAWMAGYLLLLKRWEDNLSPGKGLLLGVLGGMVWFIRPELMLFSIGAPLGLALGSGTKLLRSQGWYALLFTGFVWITGVFIAQNYFSQVFPLAFWVKSVQAYGPEIASQYRQASFREFGIFLVCNWISFGVIPGAIFMVGKKWWKGLSPVEKAMSIGLLLYLGYETLFVLQIMGYGQRFYFPILPVLLYLGMRSLVILIENRPQLISSGPIQIKWGATFAILTVVFGVFAAATWWQKPANLSRDWGKFDTLSIYKAIGENNWAQLPRWDIFPNDFKLGGTELGILGIMHPDKEVVDLTGLHDPELSRAFSVERILSKQPDVLYMPHPDYKEMHSELANSQAFSEAYLVYSPTTIQSFLGVAIRKDSPYFYQMKGILAELLVIR